jgi:hypothetical protein
MERGDLVMVRGWLGCRAGHVLRLSSRKKGRVWVRTLRGVRCVRTRNVTVLA